MTISSLSPVTPPSSSHALAKTNRREIFSWCMFDFANSSYTTIIITAIYSAFFAGALVPAGKSGDYYWALTLSISYVFVVLISPVIGSIADYTARHKRFLFITYVSCVVFTGLLFMVRSGNFLWAMTLVILSNLAFALSENLISSFLPHISTKENIGKISGYGWSFGYVGGLLSLLLCLVFLEYNKVNGHYPEWALRSTCLFTAGFFLLAGLPTMLWLRQRGTPQHTSVWHAIGQGFARLYHTATHVHKYREMFLFMISYLFYSSGIATVISFAAIYAQGELGFGQGQLILLIVVVNITSAVGAFLFGFFQDKAGAKTTLVVTLILWVITVVWAYLVKTQAGFWGVANIAGIAIGASQSSGRALVGLFAPESRRAEFYGFWGFFGKAASILGIYSFGVLVNVTGSRRVAILSTTVFFVVGLFLLLMVNEKKGIEAARK